MNHSLALKQLFLMLRSRGRKSGIPKNINPESLISALEDLKICIIKQDSYTDLPGRSCFTFEDYLANSNHRSGPYGWMHDLDTEFRIVKSEPECDLWKQKLSRGNQDHHNLIRAQQSRIAQSVHEIDFSNYDLVLAIECAVPAPVTRAHPHVLWITMLEDHRMAEFSGFSKAPPIGYDMFIDQMYGPDFWFRRRRAHLLHFPYVIPHLSRLSFESNEKKYAILDSPTEDEKLISFLRSHGLKVKSAQAQSLSEYFHLLSQSKYFISANLDSPKWGNGFIEPAAFGCLNMGRKYMYWNPCLLTEEGTIKSSEDLYPIISKFEKSEALTDKVLKKQYSLMITYCIYEPFRKLAQWIKAYGRKELLYSGKWQNVQEELEIIAGN